MMIRVVSFIFFLLVTAFVVFCSWSTPVTDQTDSFVYELPFQPGTAHRVVQGYGGLFSHQHQAALDFSMPVGTPVYAARGGRIIRYRDEYVEGGPFRRYAGKANYIIIRHNDGSFGCYWHLRKNGVAVRKGKVHQGQLIGYSGNTGFTLRPHLHFTVKSRLNYQKNSFVKTRFKTTNGVQMLHWGRAYERPRM